MVGYGSLDMKRFLRLAIPKTRGECLTGPRPCPYVTCKYHLGKVSEPTCTLDLADKGGMTLEEVGEVFGVTRERIRQIEERALEKIIKKKYIENPFE